MELGRDSPCHLIILSLAIEPLAATLRLNKDITGINIAKKEHTIGLFADNIILSLTNPNNSLQNV